MWPKVARWVAVYETVKVVYGQCAGAVWAWRRFPGAPDMIDALAVMSSLYALYDLSDFLLLGARTDAGILAQMTHVPACIWAMLWSGVSLLVVYTACHRAQRRP